MTGASTLRPEARQRSLLKFVQGNGGLTALEIARRCGYLYGNAPGFLVACCRDLRALHKGMAVSKDTSERPERWYA